MERADWLDGSVSSAEVSSGARSSARASLSGPADDRNAGWARRTLPTSIAETGRSAIGTDDPVTITI